MTSSPALFNASALRATAGGDDALMGELADIFLRIVPPMAARLRHAVDAAETSAIADETHGLRSCLAMMGAAGLEARCRQLEQAARRGQGPSAPEDAALCAGIELLVAEVRAFRAGTARSEEGEAA